MAGDGGLAGEDANAAAEALFANVGGAVPNTNLLKRTGKPSMVMRGFPPQLGARLDAAHEAADLGEMEAVLSAVKGNAAHPSALEDTLQRCGS